MRATLVKLDVADMKSKLKKVFGYADKDQGACSMSLDPNNVKIENINIAEGDESEFDVLYGRYYPQSQFRGGNQAYRGYARGNRRGGYKGSSSFQRVQFGNKVTATDRKPKRLRCAVCESVFHLANQCPDKTYYCEEQDEASDFDVVLYQSNLISADQFNAFLVEASNSAVLDSGASATVAGKAWFESYCGGMSKDDRESIQYSESVKNFRFGSGESFKSIFRAKIPAKIGAKTVGIEVDVIESSIPLLLSRDAMKRAKTEIDFVNDEVKMFGETQDVYVTNSGHYAIPLN